jgi:demethylmenaquinone methyltransferase/2-methoxy-6-polyprenyl-1,4-benzoquinol methylase
VGKNADLIRYYSARADEYEEIYSRPERQQDLARLRRRVRELVAGERVLEFGCGTGYWTRVIAETATEVRAVDASRESIEIARQKGIHDDRVTFVVADFYDLRGDLTSYSTMVSGFLWSHIPVEEIDEFLPGLAVRLRSGASALFFDNRYVDGSSSPISHRDAHGNSYQERRLASGETFTIIKNFPTRVELLELARRVGSEVEVEELRYFWLLRFKFG